MPPKKQKIASVVAAKPIEEKALKPGDVDVASLTDSEFYTPTGGSWVWDNKMKLHKKCPGIAFCFNCKPKVSQLAYHNNTTTLARHLKQEHNKDPPVSKQPSVSSFVSAAKQVRQVFVSV